MSSFYPKDALVMDRQLKVQRLVIPFTVTHSATPASVVLVQDEPSCLFLKSEGVDQITGALASGETATYSVAPNDVNGIMNIFIKVGESVSKVQQANVIDRVNGGSQPVKLGSSTGLSSKSNIMLTLDSTVNHATTDANYCLQVDYVVSDGN